MYKAIIYLSLIAASSAQYLPNGCPSDFHIHLLLPHETDCSKYYSCSNGNKIEMSCKSGMLFDALNQICKIFAEGGCTLGSGTTGSTTIETGITKANLCPPGVWGNVPHPDLCNSYYLCAGGQGIQLFCSDRFEFDPEFKVCVLIAEGGCTLGLGTTTTTGTDTTSTGSYTTSGISTTTYNPHTTGSTVTTTAAITSTTGSTTTETGITEADLCPPGEWGNVPHPEQCNSFYMCAGGNAIQLFCRDGFEFDPELEICVVIAESGCTLGSDTTTTGTDTTSTGSYTTSVISTTIYNPPTTGSTNTTTLASSTGLTTTETGITEADLCPPGVWGNVPHPELCNSYYLCAGGQGIQLFCSDRFEFDPEFKVCVLIAEGGCTLGVGTTTTTGTDTTSTGSYTTSGISTTTYSPHTTGSTDTTTAGITRTTGSTTTETGITEADLCPPGIWGNVPHPELCNSFYMCAGGNAIQLFCTDAFEFDPELESCIPITEGGCTLGSGTTTTVTDRTSTALSTTSGIYTISGISTTTYNPHTTGSTVTTTAAVTSTIGSTTIETGITEADLCPPGVWGNVPHPDLCHSFYFCVDGYPIQLFCSYGFEFDHELEFCVAIAEGGCTLRPVTTTTEAITTTVGDSTTAPELCPVGVFGNVPHPEQCNSFYMCAGGNAIQLFCRDGFEFDPEQNICVVIAEGGCTLGSDTTTTGTDTTSTGSYTTSTGSYTTSGISTTTYNPHTTGSTDTTTAAVTSTTGPTTTETGITEADLCPPGIWGNVPHPEQCNSFYMCAGGNAIQLFCRHGFEFDPELEICVVIAEGGCTLGSDTTTTGTDTTSTGSYTTSEISTTTYNPHTTGSTDTTTAAITSTTGSTTTETGITEADLCPPGVWGNVPHPDLCNSYYLCAGGQGIQLFCSDRFEFDPELKICVLIAEGGCTLGLGTTTTTGIDTTLTGTYTTSGISTTTYNPHTTGSTVTTTAAITSTTGSTTTETGITEADLCPPGVWGNVPHPEQCNSFYMCAGGNAIQLFCRDGFEFDPELEICVVIAEGGCTLGSDTTTTGTDTTSTGSYTTSVISTTIYNPPTTGSTNTTTAAIASSTGLTTTETGITEADLCPPGVWGNVPHPDLCNSYYLCAGGQGIQLFCSDRFEFDPELKICVLIAEGGCTLGLGTTTTTGIDTTLTGTYTTSGISTTTYNPHTTGSTVTTTAAITSTTGSTTTETGITEADLCPPGVWGNVPHPEQCNSFYMCAGGNAIQLFCRDGFEFDPELETCVVIAEGGCTLGSGTTTTGTDTTSTESYTTSGISTTTYNPPTTGSTNTTTAAVTSTTGSITTETGITDADLCPPGIWGNVPHPELCNSFYMCAGGNALKLFCRDGFEFDPELDRCVVIAEGGCTLGPGTTATGTDTTSTGSYTTSTGSYTTSTGSYTTSTGSYTTPAISTTTYNPHTTGSTDTTTAAVTSTTGSTTTETGITEADLCPPGIWGNVPHPELCNSFYICAGGNAIQLFCTDGFEFNLELESCIFITEGGCTLGSGTTTTVTDRTSTTLSTTSGIYTTSGISTTTYNPHTTGSTVTTTAAVTSTIGSTTIETGITEADLCPPGVWGNVPHPDLCNSFYFCVDGYPIQLFCSYGFEFDYELEFCVAIAEGGCTLRPATTTTEAITTTVGDATTPELCPVGVFDNVPHPELCNSYYLCIGGIVIQMFCADGFEFDPALKICVAITEEGCTLGPAITTTEVTTTTIGDSTTTPELCPVGVFDNVPHPELCNSFYMCASGNATQLLCRDGFEFDPELKICVSIAEGGCTLKRSASNYKLFIS